MQYAFNGDVRQMRSAGNLRLRSTGDLQLDLPRPRDILTHRYSGAPNITGKRPGKVSLRPVQTVSGSIAFGRPYSAPFSVR
jgi:hypothetical protein